MVGKIYAGILVNIVRKVTEGFIDNEQGGFRSGRGCIDQIFTIEHIDKKRTRAKTYSLCEFNGFKESV